MNTLLDFCAPLAPRAEVWRIELWVVAGIALCLWLNLPAAALAEVSDPNTASRATTLQNQPPEVAQKLEQPPAPELQALPPSAITFPPLPGPPQFYIREYQVKGGGHLLPSLEVEEAVYPFLGPARTANDVEQARAALEKAYHDKGFQTVSVIIPPQKNVNRTGLVLLEVVRGEVARLRVHGSRYYSISEIKSQAPSLAEGTTPNFNDVQKDLVNLNQLPDRRVTPSLRAGEIPGTVDVDLVVKDTPPLHGSLELNNRYSVDTSPLRLNGSFDYDNLWQLGHTFGASFQVSPEDFSQVKVASAYYLARLPDVSWLSFMLQGTIQDSNVSTLGGIGVAGKGDIIGPRLVFNLPSLPHFYSSITLGFDYKYFDQNIQIAGNSIRSPVTYYPISAAYSATWAGQGYVTQLDASATAGMRQFSSPETDFEANRHGAGADFIYLRGDLSDTRDLPEGFQVFDKVQGQASDEPLLNSEQFSGGGLGTVRGYLESEALGDNALFGSLEFRSPSLTSLLGKSVDEWRFYLFGDGGLVASDEVLPGQANQTDLASVGAGTRLRLASHYNGSLDVAMPLLAGPNTAAYSVQLTFRLWAEF